MIAAPKIIDEKFNEETGQYEYRILMPDGYPQDWDFLPNHGCTAEQARECILEAAAKQGK